MLNPSTADVERSTLSSLAPKWQGAEILEAIFGQVSDALLLYDKDLKNRRCESSRR